MYTTWRADALAFRELNHCNRQRRSRRRTTPGDRHSAWKDVQCEQGNEQRRTGSRSPAPPVVTLWQWPVSDAGMHALVLHIQFAFRSRQNVLRPTL